MLSKQLPVMHFSDKVVNDDLAFSAFDLYLKQLDYQKRFLLQSDVDQLSILAPGIDTNLLNSTIILPDVGYKLLNARIGEVEEITKKLLAGGFDYNLDEKYETDPDKLKYATSLADLSERCAGAFPFGKLLTAVKTGCEQQGRGSAAENGQGYGAGGGGTYLNVKFSNGEKRKSGYGGKGICVVAWGTLVTGRSLVDADNNIVQDVDVNSIDGVIFDPENNEFVNINTINTIEEIITAEHETEDGKTETETITVKYDDYIEPSDLIPDMETDQNDQQARKDVNMNTLKILKLILGYDVLEKNFLNQKRYTVLDLEEKPEYISETILNQLDDPYDVGHDLTIEPEDKQ
jgi:hypothetical protein